jgi:glycosyltransferase involved in cell wall biosynthesis
VLDQDFDQEGFEVIVVNDSGQTLPESDWLESERVTVIATGRRERSVARNSGAAIARGRYLHFLDDDDWLLPGALQKMWELAQVANDADWIYGGIRIVDLTGKCWGELNSGLNGNCFAQFMGGAWAPIQVSLISAKAFFGVGGFDPLIPATQDLDLCRRISLHGSFANTSATIANALRDVSWGSSTNYEKGPEYNRRSRDALLDETGAFRQIKVSANSRYWKGRVFRVCVASFMLNLRLGRIFAALSRAALGLRILAITGSGTYSLEFWRAFKAEYVPDSLYHVLVSIERGRNE